MDECVRQGHIRAEECRDSFCLCQTLMVTRETCFDYCQFPQV